MFKVTKTIKIIFILLHITESFLNAVYAI